MANFKKNLHIICRKNSIIESNEYIHFKDGYLYATNGQALIKQSLKLHEFNENEIELLNGGAVHHNIFKIMKNFYSLDINQDGTKFICYLKHNINKVEFEINRKIKFPNFEKIISGSETRKQTKSTFFTDTKIFNDLNSLLFDVKYIEHSDESMLLHSDLDELGIIYSLNKY